MKIHHLNCGTFRPYGGRLSSSAVDSAGARAVCHCLLIETDSAGLVLVETGIGARAALGALGPFMTHVLRSAYDPTESAVSQVRALGHDPADVRHILLTHLDLDHAGGLVDFPQAEVHLAREELAAGMRPRALRERTYAPRQWQHGPRWRPFDRGGDEWFGIPGVRSLPGLPEILAVPLPGHTRGHTGYALDRSEGAGPRWLLHGGDSHYAAAQRDPDPSCPPLLAAFQRMGDLDRRQRLESMARVREVAREPAVSVVCAHDPLDLDRCLQEAPR